jgi:predicted RNA-binding Zn-ribbon protein involved in translation (DUF1610 family)
MNEETLAQAAFWDSLVCLDCNDIIPHEGAPEGTCPSCGSDAVYSAEFLLRVASWLNSD